jgi:hypothetical protein
LRAMQFIKRKQNMKLTDFLQDVGRPVAYYPKLRKITGSTNATILLCQFIYWRGKESDKKESWLYKTSAEIEEETGLSYDEQKTARRNLVEAGLMEEHYARLDHQMKFRLILDTIDEKWGKPKSDIPESGNAMLGKDEIPCSLNESETTTETTPITQTKKTVQEQADQKVNAILELEANAAKEKTKNWTYREKFSFNADVLDFADLCAAQFGPPSKKELMLWIAEIGGWCDFGCRAKDWPRAKKIVDGFSTPVLSVTGMTKALRAARQERRGSANTPTAPVETDTKGYIKSW